MTARARDKGVHVQLERLESLQARQAELQKSLNRSLAIDMLWPGVFDQGPVRSNWISTGGNLRLRVRNGLGESREFVRALVPACLHSRVADDDANEIRKRCGKPLYVTGQEGPPRRPGRRK